MARKTLLGGVAFAALATSIAAAPVAAAAPSVTATVADGTLHVQGSPHADQITLRVSPDDRTSSRSTSATTVRPTSRSI